MKKTVIFLVIIILPVILFAVNIQAQTTNPYNQNLPSSPFETRNQVVQSQQPDFAVVDYQRVFNQYHRTASVRQQLYTERQRLQQEMDRYLNDYNSWRQNLITNLDYYSQEERENIAQALTDMETQIEQRRVEQNDELTLLESQLKQEIMQEIRIIIIQVRRERGLSYVIDSSLLLDYDPSLDITNEIITRINSNQR